MENQTKVEEFILLGLTDDPELQHILFAPFLLLYMACLLGNGAILMVVLAEPRLHTPMYFFLGNLSCLDICYSTVTIPKMLSGFLMGDHTISFLGYLTQLSFFHFLGCGEVVLLSVMAYDHYVAICNPLRYSIIMNKWVCLRLAVAVWVAGFLYGLTQAVMTSHIWFCGPNYIKHFICDIQHLIKLACSNTALNLIILNVLVGCLGMASFFGTCLSYFYIVSFLFLKFQTWQSRLKAFSTCISHLTVVTLLLIPPLLNYVLPSTTDSSQREMIMTVLYGALTPVLNPLIYTLRNEEVKSSVRRILNRKLLPGRTRMNALGKKIK